ncbi:hypothetical protein MKX01_013617 [Papaver californicum]|nr:hypothetical protein MKX01_013617 [Papaver californicum]
MHTSFKLVTYQTKHTFTEASGFGWKKPSIFRYSELHDSSKGYIKNDSCVIKLEISCNCSVSTTQIKPKDGESSVDLREHPGQPFEEGRHNIKGDFCEGEEFIDIGGFSVSRTQASLYELIWAKYGHIPSTKVIPISSYTSLVMVVKDLMSSVIDMHQCRLVELSTEMIDVWDDKIKMAEKLEFNISWLRERLESVKKSVPGMQKFKTGLLEHGQPLRAAKSNMKAISDMLKKAEAQLDAAKDYVRQNASGLLSESDIEMYLEMGENLLFDGMF